MLSDLNKLAKQLENALNAADVAENELEMALKTGNAYREINDAKLLRECFRLLCQYWGEGADNPFLDALYGHIISLPQPDDNELEDEIPF